MHLTSTNTHLVAAIKHLPVLSSAAAQNGPELYITMELKPLPVGIVPASLAIKLKSSS
jgi:hypothetical protein